MTEFDAKILHDTLNNFVDRARMHKQIAMTNAAGVDESLDAIRKEYFNLVFDEHQYGTAQLDKLRTDMARAEGHKFAADADYHYYCGYLAAAELLQFFAGGDVDRLLEFTKKQDDEQPF